MPPVTTIAPVPAIAVIVTTVVGVVVMILVVTSSYIPIATTSAWGRSAQGQYGQGHYHGSDPKHQESLNWIVMDLNTDCE
jgi:uncharacterized protein with FMN-binding domain